MLPILPWFVSLIVPCRVLELDVPIHDTDKVVLRKGQGASRSPNEVYGVDEPLVHERRHCYDFLAYSGKVHFLRIQIDEHFQLQPVRLLERV